MKLNVLFSSLIAIVLAFSAMNPSAIFAETAEVATESTEAVTESAEVEAILSEEAPVYEDVIELENSEVEILAEQSEPATVEQLSEYYNTNLESVNIENFEEEYEFLTTDEIFNQMEEIVAIQEVEAALSQEEVNAQWVPVAAAAIRVLTSKVGKKGMEKGWKIARPHIEKALKNLTKYKIDGPSGGRIIQVRLKSNSQPIFRLDYHYIDGKGPYLHYHVSPNMKTHHFL
ncbi:hypothetical protein [Peribacillus frigoritolerans]|uniref:hypothetical protein n=1 Tax=Peribacillus frigoritolerans TaxID=450367 RepID=UPI00203C29F2|nr:hypothetical protein [Peribacillus frigoritolerans]MCM3169666.1 hypothetical protein [Peribacillus frigoritolerans]